MKTENLSEYIDAVDKKNLQFNKKQPCHLCNWYDGMFYRGIGWLGVILRKEKCTSVQQQKENRDDC